MRIDLIISPFPLARAMAHGHDNWVDDIVDDKISISDYPLSAAVTCSKLTSNLEDLWGIL